MNPRNPCQIPPTAVTGRGVSCAIGTPPGIGHRDPGTHQHGGRGLPGNAGARRPLWDSQRPGSSACHRYPSRWPTLLLQAKPVGGDRVRRPERRDDMAIAIMDRPHRGSETTRVVSQHGPSRCPRNGRWNRVGTSAPRESLTAGPERTSELDAAVRRSLGREVSDV
jgi:hypothetical protein